MKQKFRIFKNDDNRLVIQEFGELDKDVLSLLCEENYEDSRIAAAVASGKEKVIAALRTKNMYPPRGHAEKIAEQVMTFYENHQTDPMEITIDEPAASYKEIMSEEFLVDIEEEEDDAEIIDDLLDEDFDGESDESDDIKIDSSIKIADDDAVDVEDEL